MNGESARCGGVVLKEEFDKGVVRCDKDGSEGGIV